MLLIAGPLHRSWADAKCLLHAGTPQEQLATCDAIKPQEHSLWEAQDILAGALPQALSEAFQTVEHDFLQTTKVCGLPIILLPCLSAQSAFAL